MCTVVILRRPEHDWPVIIGANRDEMADRAWLPPARHWRDRENVVAGYDALAGGSWMGINDDGVVACILNRVGSLGPAAGRRSRGELVLEALDHADAAGAAEAFADIDPASYRTFNLLIADNRDAFAISHRDPTGSLPVDVRPVAPGISIVTAADMNDPTVPRDKRHRPLFERAIPPDPDNDQWTDWAALMSSRSPPGSDPREGMTIVSDNGFGTVSSSLLALPSSNRPERLPVWMFAPGRPDEARWQPIPLA